MTHVDRRLKFDIETAAGFGIILFIPLGKQHSREAQVTLLSSGFYSIHTGAEERGHYLQDLEF